MYFFILFAMPCALYFDTTLGGGSSTLDLSFEGALRFFEILRAAHFKNGWLLDNIMLDVGTG